MTRLCPDDVEWYHSISSISLQAQTFIQQCCTNECGLLLGLGYDCLRLGHGCCFNRNMYNHINKYPVQAYNCLHLHHGMFSLNHEIINQTRKWPEVSIAAYVKTCCSERLGLTFCGRPPISSSDSLRIDICYLLRNRISLTGRLAYSPSHRIFPSMIA